MRVALGDLSASNARLCLDVEKFCQRFPGMTKGARLLLAVSGGADSTALAVILTMLAPRLGVSLCAAHVNHSLRSEADEDASWTISLCQELGLNCHYGKIDTIKIAAERHCGLEEAGRNGRYEFLEKTRKLENAAYVFLGHHAGDLCEDIIMRLSRGAAWPALGGMKAVRGYFARPLLRIMPHSLKNLLVDCGISWREDKTNASMAFKRNRIRKLVLPLLIKENPSFERNAINLNDFAKIDEEYWEQILKESLDANPWQLMEMGEKKSLKLPKTLLSSLHPAARLRLYQKVFNYLRDCFNISCQPRGKTLLKLDEALVAGKGGSTFQFPGEIEAGLKKGEIVFNVMVKEK